MAGNFDVSSIFFVFSYCFREILFFFFFNDPATTEIYPLSLHAALPIWFRHITDLAAMDHILFLLALAAIYRGRDWRRSLWVISAFTIGHSATLALAVTGAVVLPTALIEFLIPLTIVATCVENLLVRDRARAWWGGRYRPVFAGVFGLVHGAGFANYLRGLFVAPIALPLFGFNLGIELGQIAVLALKPRR